jgi:hypothetical protein
MSAIDHLTWHRRAIFYAMRKHDISSLQTLIDVKVDTSINQCDVKPCSPPIYCFQARDRPRAKCFLDNGASLRRKFAGKQEWLSTSFS